MNHSFSRVSLRHVFLENFAQLNQIRVNFDLELVVVSHSFWMSKGDEEMSERIVLK